MKIALLAAFLSVALAGSASSQAGGFTVGDVWESNDALHLAPPFNGTSLRRIDPSSGAVSVMLGSQWTSGFGSLAFDPYRHRLIWRGTMALPAQKLWQVNGAGVPQDMGLAMSSYQWFAPVGDGRIFCIDNTGGPRYLAWIDAANRPHRVLDAAGLLPYALPAGPFQSTRGLVYDAATNAVYCCSTVECDGVNHQRIVIGKLALSADGTRVTGAPTCATADITTGFIEEPTALSRMPNGNILVVCIAPEQLPHIPLARLLSFDPVAFSLSTFALVGDNDGINYRLDDGVWSSELGKAFVLDTFQANFRAWAPGEVGNGSVITPVGGPVAIPSAEAEQIAEISPTACDGAWVPYSIGLKGKGNFVPALIGAGCPEPGNAFTLNLSDVVGGASGTLFVGLAPGAAPFKGGTFAVGAVLLNVNVVVGGAPGVAGAGTLSLPAGLPADPGLTGISIYMQGGFSDTAAVKGVSLTQGLQMEIG